MTSFVRGQDQIYGQVIEERADGQKQTDWMWFIFRRTCKLSCVMRFDAKIENLPFYGYVFVWYSHDDVSLIWGARELEGQHSMNIIHAAQVGQGGPVRIACMNLSKTDLGISFDKLTATLQKCFDQHFFPIWGYPVTLYNTIKPLPSDWQFVYFDNADTAGALGYHDITKDGQPVAKVFVETTIAAHEVVSVTACHELF